MRVSTISALLLGTALLVGCGSGTEADGETPAGPETASVDHHDDDGHEHAGHGHDGHAHGGWWCPEHGVPEDECALCDTSLVASFKEKGDWCELHDRPDSQCFLCDPSRFDKFAARYEAKYGKPPEKPEEMAEAK